MQVSSAPGKLILSGEHAVIYGNPALGVAVKDEVCIDITPNAQCDIRLSSPLLGAPQVLTTESITAQYEKINNRYQQFLQQQCTIQDVITTPEQLLIATLHLALTHCQGQNNPAINITLNSTIPPGSGLGSSAAAILSLLLGLCAYFKHPLTKDQAFRFALQAENLQHGHSSGIDISLSLAGGCQWYQQQQLKPRKIPQLPLYILFTGQPICSTGECVSHVKTILANNKPLLHQFAEVTGQISDACEHNNYELVKQGIKENHRLLCQIEVVPIIVREMIKVIEKFGDAAKICGAGAVRGDKAGYVLLLCNEDPLVKYKKYDWARDIKKLAINPDGAKHLCGS